MKMPQKTLITVAAAACLNLTCIMPLKAEDTAPDYLQQAQSSVAKLVARGEVIPELNEEVTIARSILRNAETEYKGNLKGWGNKLDPKAEPRVRYLADLARLQADILLSKYTKFDQEKEKVRLDGLITQVKAKIKIFDDLVLQVKDLKKKNTDQASQITSITAKVASLNAELSAKGSAITSSDKKTNELLKALDEQKKATESSEQRVAALNLEVATLNKDLAAQNQELAGLKQQTAQLQASGEQLAAEKRVKSFEAEVGKLGGIVKTLPNGSLSVTFSRSQMLKTVHKQSTITAEGDKLNQRLASLLQAYPEYKLKLKVHGFGLPVKSEDATATEQMARVLGEQMVGKYKLDPALIEAVGTGPAEPLYPKQNIEGNRRIEAVFTKK